VPKILERDGKVVVRQDGRIALDCDPDCCGPTKCFFFARYIPCAPSGTDPACDPPAGFDVVYICIDSLCTLDSPFRPGQPLRAERPQDVPVIFFEGKCWRQDGGVTRPELPEGARVIEFGSFLCLNTCNDPICGTIQLAEARRCEPGYVGPPVLYCPSGLPWECNATTIDHMGPGLPTGCWVFRRDAPTQAYPANTPIVYFQPGAYIIRNCCRCNCNPGANIPPIFCADLYPNGFPNGCCPTNEQLAAGTVVVDITLRNDLNPQGFNLIETTHWSGSGPPNAIPIREVYTARGIIIQDLERDLLWSLAARCPVGLPLAENGSDPFATPSGQVRERCEHFRSIDRLTAGLTFFNPGSNRVTLDVSVRMIAAQPVGCSNDDCEGVPLPATGFGMDPALAGMLEQQMRLGGCRGCGDGYNPA